eukprot:TRINITY_DN21182_c0_g1_i4.p1 TRINITY_DN21182_c0_g1~~TRINITY_DN21182_c0_g1_i4.p1  ORF type:complete len:2393 (+),score=799.41 TRINITY_DN21182_c0_g1_i4:97-7275(+)
MESVRKAAGDGSGSRQQEEDTVNSPTMSLGSTPEFNIYKAKQAAQFQELQGKLNQLAKDVAAAKKRSTDVSIAQETIERKTAQMLASQDTGALLKRLEAMEQKQLDILEADKKLREAAEKKEAKAREELRSELMLSLKEHKESVDGDWHGGMYGTGRVSGMLRGKGLNEVLDRVVRLEESGERCKGDLQTLQTAFEEEQTSSRESLEELEKRLEDCQAKTTQDLKSLLEFADAERKHVDALLTERLTLVEKECMDKLAATHSELASLLAEERRGRAAGLETLSDKLQQEAEEREQAFDQLHASFTDESIFTVGLMQRTKALETALAEEGEQQRASVTAAEASAGKALETEARSLRELLGSVETSLRSEIDSLVSNSCQQLQAHDQLFKMKEERYQVDTDKHRERFDSIDQEMKSSVARVTELLEGDATQLREAIEEMRSSFQKQLESQGVTTGKMEERLAEHGMLIGREQEKSTLHGEAQEDACRQLKELRGTLSTTQLAVADLSGSFADCNDKLAGLLDLPRVTQMQQASLTQLESSIEKLRSQAQGELQKEISVLQDGFTVKLTSSQAVVEELRTQVNIDLKKDISDLRQFTEKLESQDAAVGQAIEEMRSSFQKQLESHSKMEERLAEQGLLIGKEQEKSTLHSEAQEDMCRQLEELRGTSSTTRLAVADLSGSFADCHDKLAGLLDLPGVTQLLQASLVRLEASIQKVHSQVQGELQQDVSALQDRLSDKLASRAVVEEVRTQVTTDLKKEISILRQFTEEKLECQDAAVAQAKRHLADEHAEAIEKAETELRRHSMALEDHKQRQEDLRSEIVRADEEVRSLRAKLQDHQAASASASEKVKELGSRVEEVASGLRQDSSDLQRQLKEQHEEADALRSDVTALQSKSSEDLASKVQELQGAISKATDAVTEDVTHCRHSVDDFHYELRKLKGLVAESQAEAKKRAEKLALQSNSMFEMVEKCKATYSTMLQGEMRELRCSLSELQADVTAQLQGLKERHAKVDQETEQQDKDTRAAIAEQARSLAKLQDDAGTLKLDLHKDLERLRSAALAEAAAAACSEVAPQIHGAQQACLDSCRESIEQMRELLHASVASVQEDLGKCLSKLEGRSLEDFERRLQEVASQYCVLKSAIAASMEAAQKQFRELSESRAADKQRTAEAFREQHDALLQALDKRFEDVKAALLPGHRELKDFKQTLAAAEVQWQQLAKRVECTLAATGPLQEVARTEVREALGAVESRMKVQVEDVEEELCKLSSSIFDESLFTVSLLKQVKQLQAETDNVHAVSARAEALEASMLLLGAKVDEAAEDVVAMQYAADAREIQLQAKVRLLQEMEDATSKQVQEQAAKTAGKQDAEALRLERLKEEWDALKVKLQETSTDLQMLQESQDSLRRDTDQKIALDHGVVEGEIAVLRESLQQQTDALKSKLAEQEGIMRATLEEQDKVAQRCLMQTHETFDELKAANLADGKKMEEHVASSAAAQAEELARVHDMARGLKSSIDDLQEESLAQSLRSLEEQQKFFMEDTTEKLAAADRRTEGQLEALQGRVQKDADSLYMLLLEKQDALRTYPPNLRTSLDEQAAAMDLHRAGGQESEELVTASMSTNMKQLEDLVAQAAAVQSKELQTVSDATRELELSVQKQQQVLEAEFQSRIADAERTAQGDLATLREKVQRDAERFDEEFQAKGQALRRTLEEHTAASELTLAGTETALRELEACRGEDSKELAELVAQSAAQQADKVERVSTLAAELEQHVARIQGLQEESLPKSEEALQQQRKLLQDEMERRVERCEQAAQGELAELRQKLQEGHQQVQQSLAAQQGKVEQDIARTRENFADLHTEALANMQNDAAEELTRLASQLAGCSQRVGALEATGAEHIEVAIRPLRQRLDDVQAEEQSASQRLASVLREEAAASRASRARLAEEMNAWQEEHLQRWQAASSTSSATEPASGPQVNEQIDSLKSSLKTISADYLERCRASDLRLLEEREARTELTRMTQVMRDTMENMLLQEQSRRTEGEERLEKELRLLRSILQKVAKRVESEMAHQIKDEVEARRKLRQRLQEVSRRTSSSSSLDTSPKGKMSPILEGNESRRTSLSPGARPSPGDQSPPTPRAKLQESEELTEGRGRTRTGSDIQRMGTEPTRFPFPGAGPDGDLPTSSKASPSFPRSSSTSEILTKAGARSLSHEAVKVGSGSSTRPPEAMEPQGTSKTPRSSSAGTRSKASSRLRPPPPDAGGITVDLPVPRAQRSVSPATMPPVVDRPPDLPLPSSPSAAARVQMSAPAPPGAPPPPPLPTLSSGPPELPPPRTAVDNKDSPAGGSRRKTMPPPPQPGADGPAAFPTSAMRIRLPPRRSVGGRVAPPPPPMPPPPGGDLLPSLDFPRPVSPGKN